MHDLRVEREDFETALSQVRPSALRETLLSVPEVSWSDIGGLESAKKRLRELVEYPLRNPKALAATRLMRRDGALLYGPPGAGKTLLAQAIAKECGVNFIAVDGPELFTKWLGESEEGVRHIFRIARQVAPTVLFFDQLDAIAPIRGQHSGSMTTDRVVNQLLSELDGVEQLARVIVIGATNGIDLIDPSTLRPGRFGMRISVPLPDAGARREIVRIHLLANASFGNERDLEAIVEALANATEGFSGAQLRQVCDEAQWNALRSVDFAEAVAPTLVHALEALELKREDQ